MNFRLALISGTVAVMLIGNLAVMADRSQRDFKHEIAVANEVANTGTDKVTDTVTETEVYKVACVELADGYCKEYSVRRITRE